MSEELKQLREKIDIIDTELLDLVNQRARLAQEVGKIKKSGIIYRPEREAQILTRLQSQNPGPIANENIAQLFTEVMSQCRALEKPMVVAYLGPSGTFSEEATIKRFGHTITALACDSIDEVFNKVESGAAGYGVVPAENSSEGAIGRTMDLLLQTSSTVCGEVLLPVHQFLIAQQTDLSKINKIYSHPQSFAQCHQWLRTNLPQIPSTQFINASSNADAARQASENEHSAAVASKRAAEIFELSICAENIEEDPKNTTRFLVIGTQDVEASGKDKTSLAMLTNNKSGAIYKLLAPLADHKVSMSRLESRPSRTGLWQYVFFVDVEGHKHDKNVSAALKEIDKMATSLRILGSYPAT